MDTQSSFQFGVEIELLMGSRKKAHSSWKSLAKDVSKRLQNAGINNHVNDGNDKTRENYREWSIVQEVTIPSQPAKNLCMITAIQRIVPCLLATDELTWHRGPRARLSSLPNL